MSKIEVNTIAPQSGTTLMVGEAGDTVDISNATLSANLNASSLTSGTIPDARFPATLPALNGSNLTNIQIAGGYTACDSITVTNTDTFALTAGGSPVSPASANNCIVSLNGVIQAPGNSYTISGSNIVFSSALTAGSDVIDFITVLGTALNVGTVSDGTIGLSKLSATGTKDATTFLRGDNTFAVPGGGKVLQVVSGNHTAQASTTSTSFQDLSTNTNVSITPSSASSKILVMAHFNELYYNGVTSHYLDVTAAGTQIVSGHAMYFPNLSGEKLHLADLIYLHSPNTTSSVQYKMRFRSQNGTAVVVNQNSANGGSSLILMEIGA